MQRANHFRSGLLVLVLLAGLPHARAAAAEQTLTLDPATTKVTFLLGATGHDVEGTLHLRGGEVRFDPATGAAEGEIAIDATAAETGNDGRDKTMRKKVLESERHPLIRFRPQRLEGEVPRAGESEIALHGTVTLLGEEHPLTLPARVRVEGDRVNASTTFTVPYVEWGLHDPSIFVLRVAKEVEVTVEAEGSLAR